jgi:hypothetical protein
MQAEAEKSRHAMALGKRHCAEIEMGLLHGGWHLNEAINKLCAALGYVDAAHNIAGNKKIMVEA